MRHRDICTGVSGNSVLCDTDAYKKTASIQRRIQHQPDDGFSFHELVIPPRDTSCVMTWRHLVAAVISMLRWVQRRHCGTRWHVGPQPTRQAVSPKMEVKPRGDSRAAGLGFTRAQCRVLIGFLTQKARATAPVSNEIYWGLSSSVSARCSIWGLRCSSSGVYASGKQDVGSFHVTPSPAVSCPHD